MAGDGSLSKGMQQLLLTLSVAKKELPDTRNAIHPLKTEVKIGE
tara:strand:- start:173 stop:304 length:132 start_codon:yes stop_codon:yes gene_type:complete